MLTLPDLFKMQATLNRRVGLNDQRFAKAFAEPAFKASDLMAAGEWIDDMLKAMSNEIEELRNCTYWKHWSQEAQHGFRYKIKDVAAARKEVIDLLHFWISLAQILGMSPEMVSDMYRAKLAQNIKRQDDGYSITEKDLALYLWQRYPEDNPMGYSGLAESLEDMPKDVAAYYLGWAEKTNKNRPDGSFSTAEKALAWELFKKEPHRYGVTAHAYRTKEPASSLEDLPESVQEFYLGWAKIEIALDSPHCDCLDVKFNDGPKEDLAPVIPQPDPDCKKCGGTGYAS